MFRPVRRTAARLALLGTLGALCVWSLALPEAGAAKKKPKEEPEPSSSGAGSGGKPAFRLEVGACPPDSLTELEPEALVTFLRKRCRNLKVPDNAAPTDIAAEEVLVAACSRSGEAMEAKECALHGQVVVTGDSPTTVQLAGRGDLAIGVETAKIERMAKPANGTPMTLIVWTGASATPPGEGEESAEVRAVRAPLAWRKSHQPYGHGSWFWFPMPMFTTDFTAAPNGYRFGITPIALALGTRVFPSASGRGYVGLSAFGAWNLLVPNDTQTLSNGTSVRINYKSLGGGLLIDASGFLGVGIGVGHTFTTDARTDFRTWIYFGPRLFSWLVDF